MTDDTPSKSERLAEILGSIQDRMNRGEPIDMEAERLQHPEFADELGGFHNFGRFVDEALEGTRPSLVDEQRLDLKRFPIERRLPDSAVGTVYLLGKGRHAERRELVVLRGWFTPQERQSIEESVRYAMAHPSFGVASIVDVGRLNQVPFIMRERIDGYTLDEIMSEVIDGAGELDFASAARGEMGGAEERPRLEIASVLAKQKKHLNALLRAFQHWAQILDQAHQKGLVHREIEPRQLVIDHGGDCRVTGIGMAWEGSGVDLQKMRDWRPHWLAPEVLDSRWGPVTWLADVYSLARGLADCLAAIVPNSTDDMNAVTMHIAIGDRNWLEELPPGLPKRLVKVLADATFPDPRRRLPNLRLFADELEKSILN